MIITTDRLARLAPESNRDIISAIAPSLDDEALSFDVNTLNRRAHFLAQNCEESWRFRRLRENLNYSAPRIPQVWPRLASRAAALAYHPEDLANAAYANKNGNGDEASGDGWRFRGRGLIQITGRGNYARFGDISGVDLIGNPDQAAEPVTAVHIAYTYWKHCGCNELADRDDVAGITRAINGPAMSGLSERKALADKAKLIFV